MLLPCGPLVHFLQLHKYAQRQPVDAELVWN